MGLRKSNLKGPPLEAGCLTQLMGFRGRIYFLRVPHFQRIEFAGQTGLQDNRAGKR